MTTTTIINNNEIQEELTHKIGNMYLIDGSVYILARSNYENIVLINVQTGNCWSDAVTVYSTYTIIKSEFRQLVGSKPFTHLKNVTITI